MASTEWSFSNKRKMNFTRKVVRFRFRSKRAEIIAWSLFFGVGVTYFVLTLLMTLVVF